MHWHFLRKMSPSVCKLGGRTDFSELDCSLLDFFFSDNQLLGCLQWLLRCSFYAIASMLWVVDLPIL